MLGVAPLVLTCFSHPKVFLFNPKSTHGALIMPSETRHVAVMQLLIDVTLWTACPLNNFLILSKMHMKNTRIPHAQQIFAKKSSLKDTRKISVIHSWIFALIKILIFFLNALILFLVLLLRL